MGRFNYLLDPVEEELQGNRQLLPPPEPVAEAEPEPELPPEAPPVAPPQVSDTAPKVAAYATSDDDVDRDDPISLAKAKIRELMFANNMAAMKPKAPTENANRSAATIANAGALIGSGIGSLAGNVTKPNTDFGDTLLKQGELDASKLDKNNMDETNFNQQLGIASLSDKTKAEKNPYDPELNDPHSAKYKAAIAEMEFASPGSFKKLNDAAIAAGLPHYDFNRKSIKNANLLSDHGATERTRENIRSKLQMQGITLSHDDRKRAEEFARRILGKEYDQGLQIEDELRKGNVAHRGFLDPSSPPSADSAKKMVEADIQTGRIRMYAKVLDKMIKDDNAKGLNPLDNMAIKQQYGLLRDSYRDWAKFGVPSGKDMEMIRDVVADPTEITSFVKAFGEPGYFDRAMQSVKDANEYAANQYGYGAEGTGGADRGPQPAGPSKDDIFKNGVKTRFGPKGEAAPAAGPAAAGQKTTPSGKPYVTRKGVADANGKIVKILYYDANSKEPIDSKEMK